MDLCPAVISYNARVKHDGSVYAFVIPELRVWKCTSCGDVLFDDATNEQVSQGLREHLGLLSPQEIRDRIRSLGLTQRAFSGLLPIAEETVSRWLSGAYIQSRAYDRLMRFVFEREEARQRSEQMVQP